MAVQVGSARLHNFLLVFELHGRQAAGLQGCLFLVLALHAARLHGCTAVVGV